MELVKYEAARKSLMEANSIDEVKLIKDKFEAIRAYARQSKDIELTNWASEIRLRAERKMGEMLTAQDMNKGAATPSHGDSALPTLAEVGITYSMSSRAQKIASVPEEEFEAVVSEHIKNEKELTSATIQRLVKSKTTTVRESTLLENGCSVDDLYSLNKKFSCIYADPPWVYGNQATRASTENHYSGLSVDKIASLPVDILTTENAHLHLWTTNAFLPESFKIMESWGFEYKSVFVWVKPQMGMGNYWRVSHEYLLFGVKGKCPFGSHSLMSWGEFDRTKHSEKPEQIRKMIEAVSVGPYLELFGRRIVTGWTVWGNQIEKSLFDEAI